MLYGADACAISASDPELKKELTTCVQWQEGVIEFLFIRTIPHIAILPLKQKNESRLLVTRCY